MNRPNFRDSSAQPIEGSCWLCGAQPGDQHTKDCSGYPRTVPKCGNALPGEES